MLENKITRGLSVGAAVAIAILAARLLWPHVSLPFSNPQQIVGPLAVAHFNPANNVVRYIIFILAPTLGWLAARGGRTFSLNAQESDAPWPRWATPALVALVVGLTAARVLTAFTEPFPEAELDFLHEGESLSAGFNFLATGKLWTGTFFVHGLFYDPLLSVLAWRWTGHVSIGSLRFLDETLRHFTPVALSFFLVVAFFALRRHIGQWRAATFTLVALGLVTLTEGKLQYLDLRDIYALFCAALIVTAIATERWWLDWLVGLVAGFGMFNTIERGAYIIICGAGAFAVAAIASRERRHWVACLSFAVGVGCSFAIVATVVGGSEFAAFGKSLVYWIRNKDLMDAYVYPTPFTRTASLYTLPMLFNGASVLVLVWAAPGYWRRCQWPWLATHAFIVMLACAYFRSALGRSDSAHVAYVATPAYLAMAWTVVRLISGRILRAFALVAAVVLAVLLVVQCARLASGASALATYAERGALLSAKDDTSFLSKEDRSALATLRTELGDESCSFVYPAEPAMHYLLRLPSCTRFYFTWFATALAHQEESLAALESAAPQHIVWAPSDAIGIDGFTAAELAPHLDAYIQSHYALEATLGRWYLGRRRHPER